MLVKLALEPEWEAKFEPNSYGFRPGRPCHDSLIEMDGTPGFDFLGFNVRQYPVARTESGKDKKEQFLGFKTLIKPSRESFRRHIDQLGEVVKGIETGIRDC
jgi:hypothetical protein